MKNVVLALCVFAACLGQARAEGEDEHNHSATPVPSYMEEGSASIVKMHEAMMKGAMASTPDESFVRAMMPMHQGAMDLAKVALKYAKDPQTRKWATEQLKVHQKQMKDMEAWLKKRP